MTNADVVSYLKYNRIITMNNRLNPNYTKMLNQSIVDIILDATPLIKGNIRDTIQERIYCIKNDTNPPLCVHCGTLRVKFQRSKWKYGDFCSRSCSTSSKLTQAKMKRTTLRRHGVTNIFQDRPRIVKARIEKYGTDKISTLPEIKAKINNTFKQKYGGHPMQTDAVKAELVSTNLNKYGVAHHTERQLSSVALEAKQNPNVLLEMVENMTTHEIADILGVTASTVHRWLTATGKFPNGVPRKGQSTQERKICQWLDENQIQYTVNDRSTIYPKELDIIIPKATVAIEVNGTYWHSELNGKHKQYHINKTKDAANSGYQLVHLWDIEVDDKWDAVVGVLRNALGMVDLIDSSTTTFREIDTKIAKEFLNHNHLLGYCAATTHVGWFCGEQLVFVVSTTPSRFQPGETEIVRVCGRPGVVVKDWLTQLSIGTDKTFVLYVDNRWDHQRTYTDCGFVSSKTTAPNYWYFHKSNPKKLMSRFKFQRSKLVSRPDVDPMLTEWEIMQLQGYDRVWDCGHTKLHYATNR